MEPEQSPPDGLLATMVSLRDTAPLLAKTPPPLAPAVLPLNVTLVRVKGAMKLPSPPPLPVAVFALIVLLVITAEWKL